MSDSQLATAEPSCEEQDPSTITRLSRVESDGREADKLPEPFSLPEQAQHKPGSGSTSTATATATATN